MNLAIKNKLTPLAGLCAWLLAMLIGTSAVSQSFSFKGQDVLVVAEEIFFDQESGITRATGNVELVVGQQRVSAGEIIYDEPNGVVIARNGVYAETEDGQRWLGDSLNLSDQFASGEIKNFRFQFDKRSRAAASWAEQDENQNLFARQLVYSPCPSCEDDPEKPLFWQIRADKAELNAETKQLKYEDVYFDLLGVPVFYMPRFRQADPREDRLTGIVDTTRGWSSLTGPETGLEYFWALDDSRNLTFTPVLKPFTGFDSELKYERALEMGDYTLAFDLNYVGGWSPNDTVLFGEATSALTLGGVANFDFDLAKHWRLQADNSWHYRRTHDLNSIQEASSTDFDWGTSSKIEGFRGPNYTLISIDDYLDEDNSAYADNIPTFVRAEHNYVIPDLFAGGSFEVHTGARGVFRTASQDNMRLTVQPSFEFPFETDFGIEISSQVGGQYDIYFAEESDATDAFASGQRIAPYGRLGIDYEMVKVTEDWMQFLVPSAAITASFFEDDSGNLPNEDARDLEIDVTNYDWVNRSSGTDLVDTGLKAHLGLDWSLKNSQRQLAAAKIGYSRHLAGADFVQENAGHLETSDFLLGDFEFNPTKHLDLDYRFTANARNGDFTRHEVFASLNGDLGSLKASYLYVDPLVSTSPVSELANANATLKFADYWSLTSGFAYNVGTERLSNANLGLVYAHPCLTLNLGYVNTWQAGDQREHRVNFAVNLLTLGDFQVSRVIQSN